jgi:hypothetical protein
VDPRVGAWFETAASSPRGDALVARMEAAGCEALSTTCDPDRGRRLLLEAAPDNAFAHLLRLGALQRSGDEAGARNALAAMANSKDFDTYMLELLGLMIDAYEGIQWPQLPDETAALHSASSGFRETTADEDLGWIQMLGKYIAIAMPGYQPLTQQCAVEKASRDPALKRDCIAAYRLMAGAEDTLISRHLALVQLARLTADDPDGAQWRERLRDWYWVHTTVMPMMPGLPGSGIEVREWLELWAQRGEFEAWRELLRRRGISDVAPPGWLPGDPRQRALVTTGRPPEE